MRIGTWNLAGRWGGRHAELVDAMECDVLLLTEVTDRVEIPGMFLHATELEMARKRRWAAVASRLPLQPLPDPHAASAMAQVDGVSFCSSILPWKGGSAAWPGGGATTAERTLEAVAAIEGSPLHVWGGDWNHAMSGRERAGSMAGRVGILAAVDRMNLTVATADCPHRIAGLLSIDHIAVPSSWLIKSVEHHPGAALAGGIRLSDHDAYVVEVADLR